MVMVSPVETQCPQGQACGDLVEWSAYHQLHPNALQVLFRHGITSVAHLLYIEEPIICKVAEEMKTVSRKKFLAALQPNR